MVELIDGWWSWIAPATLQATLLLAAAWIVDRSVRSRAWPQLLTTLWWVALARLVLPPTLESPWSVTSSLAATALDVAAPPARANALPWIAAVWIAGSAACVAVRWRERRALARKIVELDLREQGAWRAALELAASAIGLGRLPRLGTLDGLATPAVLGCLRPILLVPRAALERAPTLHDRNALLHELAHIRRRDLWLDEACELVRALFWFHPLVWLAVSRVRALSEVACDATVARVLGREARGYRDTLVLAARDLRISNEPIGARAFAGRPSALLARLEHLERTHRAPLVVVRAASTVVALAMFACVLPMASESAVMRANAQRVVDAGQRGERQSCFLVHAAAMVLAADPPSTPAPPRN